MNILKYTVLPIVLLLTGIIPAYSQTIITFQADQPDELQALAGDDAEINSGGSFTLGGPIAAMGGIEPYSYAWNDGTGIVSTEPNPSVSPETAISYTLLVTDANTCTASDTINLSLISAGTDGIIGDDIRIYPNPASERFTIDYQGRIDEIVLLDEKGNLVWRRLEYETESFPVPEISGIYLLKIITREKEIVKLITVNK